MTDFSPTPDDLLKTLRYQDQKEKNGELVVFFGMSAGVGKTYDMLKAAHAQVQAGKNVLIGIVESHGRVETEALIEGIPRLDQKKITYRDVTFEELDLDALLNQKPDIALVDEFAHTNIPGSRHTKRWQDIFELLEAGITVYTTLNVQHIESRKEMVESITGITVRETIPDSVLDRADKIKLVDLDPQDLLERLQKGKVYLGDKPALAQQHFFKQDVLAALREIAFRVVAEKLDTDLDLLSSMKSGGRLKTSDKLMVAVSHSPYSRPLVRAARRLAHSLNVPWVAVHTDLGIPLEETDKQQLVKNLALAKEMGAELITIIDSDVVHALRRVASQHGITQIVAGRSQLKWWDWFRKGSLVERVVRDLSDIDVYVFRQTSFLGASKKKRFTFPKLVFQHYWPVMMMLLVTTLIGTLLNHHLSYTNIGFLFLFMVLIVSLISPIGPILFAAIFAFLIWDFFFIPPVWSLIVQSPQDVIMCLFFGATALVTGILNNRIRRKEALLFKRESQFQVLFEIVKLMAVTPNRYACLEAISDRMGQLFGGKCLILYKAFDEPFSNQRPSGGLWIEEDSEWGVAKWVFDHHQPAGRTTDTLPRSKGFYLPLVGSSENHVGVLAFYPEGDHTLILQETHLFTTIAHQVSIYLEKELIEIQSIHLEKA